MAPADPLFLMWCGVNRITTSGRIAGENQRISREGALRAVTLSAAYSLKMEKEIGSIESGKLANFTILGDNPVTCDPMNIKDISVWGTVHEGRVLPVSQALDQQAMRADPNSRNDQLAYIQTVERRVPSARHETWRIARDWRVAQSLSVQFVGAAAAKRGFWSDLHMWQPAHSRINCESLFS